MQPARKIQQNSTQKVTQLRLKNTKPLPADYQKFSYEPQPPLNRPTVSSVNYPSFRTKRKVRKIIDKKSD